MSQFSTAFATGVAPSLMGFHGDAVTYFAAGQGGGAAITAIVQHEGSAEQTEEGFLFEQSKCTVETLADSTNATYGGVDTPQDSDEFTIGGMPYRVAFVEPGGCGYRFTCFKETLNQTATYWGPGAPDGFGGKAYSSPVTIPCRWKDRISQLIDKDGRETQSNAQVFVAQDLAVGGYLYLGTSTAASPVSGAREIRGWEKDPNASATWFTRKALL